MYESNLFRVEVIAAERRLAVRLEMKMPLYDNSPYGAGAKERRPAQLHALGIDTFELEPLLPGAASEEIRFVRSEADGRMRFLAMRSRLLARTQ